MALKEEATSAIMPANDDDEYEETTFAVELHGLFDEDSIDEAVEDQNCRAYRMDSNEPLLQIGSQLFVGKWEEIVGTDMIFREIPHRHLLSFVDVSEKRLSAQRVILIPKNKTKETAEDTQTSSMAKTFEDNVDVDQRKQNSEDKDIEVASKLQENISE